MSGEPQKLELTNICRGREKNERQHSVSLFLPGLQLEWKRQISDSSVFPAFRCLLLTLGLRIQELYSSSQRYKSTEELPDGNGKNETKPAHLILSLQSRF